MKMSDKITFVARIVARNMDLLILFVLIVIGGTTILNLFVEKGNLWDWIGLTASALAIVYFMSMLLKGRVDDG